MLCIEQYAKTALGNREYFLDKWREKRQNPLPGGGPADVFPNFVHLKSGTGQQLDLHESSCDTDCSWACGFGGLFASDAFPSGHALCFVIYRLRAASRLADRPELVC
jgi:hypothetical protein